jgi:hypothetical protein
MGTVKAGPIGIRTIYEHASSGGEDRQNIVRARIGGLHECVRVVNGTRVIIGKRPERYYPDRVRATPGFARSPQGRPFLEGTS